jgi:hypothetical protein
MICPICQKAGLTKDLIRCTQCNADLSQFHLLSKIEGRFSYWKKIGLISIFCFLISLFVVISLFFNSTTNKMNDNRPVYVKTTFDSTTIYRNKYLIAIKKNDSLIAEKRLPTIIEYKVKYGDNLSAISYMFYQNIGKFEIIAERNKLSSPYTIYVNQVLKIEIDK